MKDSHAVSSSKDTSNTTPQVWRCHDQSVAPVGESRLHQGVAVGLGPHADAGVAPSKTSIEYHITHGCS